MVKKTQHQAEQDADSKASIEWAGRLVLGAILLGSFSWLGPFFWDMLNPPVRFAIAFGGLTASAAAIAMLVNLGGADERSAHRQRYIALRESIANGGVKHFYTRGLHAMLARADRFFEGDGTRIAIRQQKAFGMQDPAPLCTPQSYDRCLLIALIYPIAVIFLAWAWYGHSGPAEAALGLKPADFARRVAALLAILGAVGGFWAFHKYDDWKQWLGLAIVAGAGAGVVAGLLRYGEYRNRQGLSLLCFSVVLLAVSIIVPRFMPHGLSSQDMVAVLYFLTLLTLVNAPFDWLALGLTRGLLRRGLERAGVWPIVLGLADLFLSIVLMLLLAIATLWATELFNYMAGLGGFTAPIDPARLFPAIIAAPFAPEHLWLIAMLFSTQIPALLNLMFGTFCLLRGVPGINRWMAAQLPESGSIGMWPRWSITAVWSLQFFFAVIFGCLGFYYLFYYGFIWLVDGWFGFTLINVLPTVSLNI